MNPEPRARTTLPWGWCAALATFALCVLVAEPPPAHAHALLDRSDPRPGVTIPTDRPPPRISLWFTEPVQVAFNGVAVLDSSDRRVERLNARVVRGDATRVEVDLGDLPQGAYLVRWHVTSADNHVVRGSYWFVVGFAATPPRAAALLGASAPPIPPLEVAARWLGLVGLSILAGAPLFQLIVLGPLATRTSPPLFLESIRRARAVWLAATGTFVLAQLLLAAAQTEAVAELPLPQAWDHAVLRVVFFDSRFAALWWTRLLLGLALGGLLVSQASRHREPAGTPVTTRLAAGLGLLLILSTSLSGHAVGARISPPLAVGIDAVHLAAAALWLGGLVELSLLLPSLLTLASAEHRSNLLRALVPSVSRAALASVLVLIATGIFNAWEHAASLKAVAATAYGQSLLLKMALLLPLLGIAAINLLIIRPRVAAGQAAPDAGLPRRFRALVLAEVLVGAVALLAAGLLGSLPPSGQQSLPAPVAVARQVGDLRVAFAIDPNWVGVSRFRVTLADTQGLPPADVRHVILTFTMEGMNMGRTNVTMKPRGEGVYEAEGFYVGMPGISQIGVAVARAGGADRNAVFRIEVPPQHGRALEHHQLLARARRRPNRDRFPPGSRRPASRDSRRARCTGPHRAVLRSVHPTGRREPSRAACVWPRLRQ